MMLNNDRQIIHRILDGRVSEYAVLVDRHKDMAFTIAYRLLNNREDAEEVTQDAFVKAFKNLSRFRQDSAFSTWLFRIVFNAAISKKRLKKPIFQNIDDLPFIKEEIEPHEDSDTLTENCLMLENALSKLPEEDRVLITLYYRDESNIDEIHTITGLSKSNIKVRLFRARKKIQELTGQLSEKVIVVQI